MIVRIQYFFYWFKALRNYNRLRRLDPKGMLEMGIHFRPMKFHFWYAACRPMNRRMKVALLEKHLRNIDELTPPRSAPCR